MREITDIYWEKLKNRIHYLTISYEYGYKRAWICHSFKDLILNVDFNKDSNYGIIILEDRRIFFVEMDWNKGNNTIIYTQHGHIPKCKMKSIWLEKQLSKKISHKRKNICDKQQEE